MRPLLSLVIVVMLLTRTFAGGPAEVRDAAEYAAAAEESAPAPEPTPEPASEPASESMPESERAVMEAMEFTPDFTFETVSTDGESWDQNCFADARLTMLNFWEPWCGPCVGEMPDLQRLSEEYADRGFQLLGVYSDFDYTEEMYQVVEETGVLYPILEYVSAFDQFQTGYVPTTVFVDQNGHVVGEPYIGSRSYEDWAAILEELL